MANAYPFWQFGEELRGHTRPSDDQKWSMGAFKLALVEETRAQGEQPRKSPSEPKHRAFKFKAKGEQRRFESISRKQNNLDWKAGDPVNEGGALAAVYNVDRPSRGNSNGNNNNNNSTSVDKRFKTLPSSEMLPRNEALGGYIFVCNNDTMQEDLKRQLFGLPQRYRDSVRAVTPGLPLFLYNYTTHQLHGIFEAASFGGSNIDPTAWEDKKCKGESRFPAQVRIRVRKLCKPMEEDAFRPVLHHYDGPKFRLQLSIPQTLALLDLFTENSL